MYMHVVYKAFLPGKKPVSQWAGSLCIFWVVSAWRWIRKFRSIYTLVILLKEGCVHLSSLCLNNFPHRFGQRVNFRISFKLNEWAMYRLLCPLYSLVSQSKNQNFCVWTNRYVTLPVLHNSPRQIPFLDCRFLQFYFLYHSSYELCYYNVHRYVSLFTRTSISIVFC